MTTTLPPLSERFIEFMKPEYPDAIPSDQTSYSLYVAAWNLAILPTGAPAIDELHRMVDGFSSADRRFVRSTLTVLLKRKRAMFPDDRRMIGECRIVRDKEGRTKLRVLWALEKSGDTIARPSDRSAKVNAG